MPYYYLSRLNLQDWSWEDPFGPSYGIGNNILKRDYLNLQTVNAIL